MKEFIILDRAHPAGIGGTQVVYKFPNGYGASVIRSPTSYGGPEGKFEIAVVEYTNSSDAEDYYLTYETPVTDDVIGYVPEAEVEGYLQQIKDLPKRS